MTESTLSNDGTSQDGGVLVRSLGAEQTVRLIAVDTSKLVEALRVAHDAGPLGTKALGRTATAAALLSATLKDRQQVGVQINGDGPLGETYSIADWYGRTRATIIDPRVELADGRADLGRGFGAGRLSVTRQLSDEAPYRGVVNLVTGEVAEDLAHYLLTSEQVPSAVSIGEILDSSGVQYAGGLLVQAMPGAKESVVGGLIERIEAMPPVAEFLRDGGTPHSLIAELIDDAQTVDERALLHYCPCSREQFARRLCTLGEEELTRLTKELEVTVAECHFCRIEYIFDQEQVGALLYGAKMYDLAD